MKIIVSVAAATDVGRLRSFLEDKNPAAAGRVAESLEKAVQSLTLFPQRGRPSSIPNVRELVVPFGRSAYVLRYVYSSERDELVALRIWHGKELRE